MVKKKFNDKNAFFGKKTAKNHFLRAINSLPLLYKKKFLSCQNFINHDTYSYRTYRHCSCQSH